MEHAISPNEITFNEGLEIYQFNDFVPVMNAILEFRKKNHPTNWSMGAWAKRLNLANTASLSNILSGRKAVSRELGYLMVASLKLEQNPSEYLCLLLELRLSDSSHSVVHLGIQRRLHLVKTMSLRTGLTMEEWEEVSKLSSLMIRELAQLKDFRFDTKWISQRLRQKVSPEECGNAIETLLRAGLLSSNNQGQIEIAKGYYETPTDISNEKIKRFHEESLTYARSCIRAVPVEDRYFMSNFISIQKSDLPRVKAVIENFRKELNSEFDRTDKTADEIYQLNLNFIPLTK